MGKARRNQHAKEGGISQRGIKKKKEGSCSARERNIYDRSHEKLSYCKQ